MSTGWLDNSFLLLLGVAGIWFFMRFVLGPRRGGPTFGSFFRREEREAVEGLGQKAIATLIADTRAFVVGEQALRGLILAGPFATRAGKMTSTVTLIALSDAPEHYRDEDWMLRWAYPARGHKVLEKRETHEPGHVMHALRLRGAPPVELHFVAGDRAAAPEVLQPAIKAGASVIEDPAGQAERLRRRWDSLHRQSTDNGKKRETKS